MVPLLGIHTAAVYQDGPFRWSVKTAGLCPCALYHTCRRRINCCDVRHGQMSTRAHRARSAALQSCPSGSGAGWPCRGPTAGHQRQLQSVPGTATPGGTSGASCQGWAADTFLAGDACTCQYCTHQQGSHHRVMLEDGPRQLDMQSPCCVHRAPLAVHVCCNGSCQWTHRLPRSTPLVWPGLDSSSACKHPCYPSR